MDRSRTDRTGSDLAAELAAAELAAELAGTQLAAEGLAAERAEAAAVLADLQADYARLVTASEGANADDEHDPEGATVGFERAQLAASISRVQAQLAELDAAAERISAGNYGICAVCGQPIGGERLSARPTARTCIRCAR